MNNTQNSNKKLEETFDDVVKKSLQHWKKLDNQTRALYIQTAAEFFPKGDKHRLEHVSRIVCYAVKMAYMANNAYGTVNAFYY